ncbi:hypothetical protein DFH08DRAFT_1030680 [Mycena albidolilacea]|uniref:Uncharacterized protein n=1 Tax=Mycena albidolilacea TaxID=1033008 RepID=A0AAD6ZGT2_9AGAR|nr:hypothetical protein DFH08DRAFT_1030680 [Mycena albidolilacea]
MDAIQVSLAVLAQTARTNGSSKTEIKNFIEESDLNPIRNLLRSRLRSLRCLNAATANVPLASHSGPSLHRRNFYADVFAWHTYPLIGAASLLVPLGFELAPWTSSRKALPGMFMRLKSWLVRSQPLSTPISCKDATPRWDSGLPDKSCNPRIIQELLRIGPRWRSVRLDGHVWPSFLEESPPESTFDNLTELNLESLLPSNSDSMIFAGTHLLRTFKAPADTNFCVHGYSSPISHWSMASPPILVSPSSCTRTEMIVHSRLRTLSLHFENHYFMPFFDALSVPALKKLVLRFNDRDLGDWGAASFTAFQLRSPHITRMELHRLNMTSQDLQIALGHAPALTHLKTYFCTYCPDRTLLGLSSTDGVEPLVPCLKYLSLLMMPGNGGELSQTALADMIASHSSSALALGLREFFIQVDTCWTVGEYSCEQSNSTTVILLF